MPDTLDTLIKVRRRACDEAMQNLVAALEQEDRALHRSREIERSVALETAIATSPTSSDAVVEAFGHWLPDARRRLAAAHGALQDQQAETTRKRAELTVCRTALESVETLREQRLQAAARQQAAKQQAELDDLRRPAADPLGPDGDAP